MLQLADSNATATPDETTLVIEQAMWVLTRFENRIEEKNEGEDEGGDTPETFKHRIAGFRDAWYDAHENGLHYHLDEMYKEGGLGQRHVGRMRNNDKSDMRLHSALRAGHECTAFVAYIKHTKVGRGSGARF